MKFISRQEDRPYDYWNHEKVEIALLLIYQSANKYDAKDKDNLNM